MLLKCFYFGGRDEVEEEAERVGTKRERGKSGATTDRSEMEERVVGCS